MSVPVGVTCLDCKELAPNVGDGGHLGAPELAAVAECDVDGEQMPSFGYLYDPLVAFGLRRYDLEAFREFLIRHQGHRFRLSAEDDAPRAAEPPDDRMKHIERLHRQFKREGDETRRRTASGEFRNAVYELRCVRCAVALASDEVELLRAFEPFKISREAVLMLAERWGRPPDDGWNYRLCGLVDPFEHFMQQLLEFLESHRDHDLEAGLKRASA